MASFKVNNINKLPLLLILVYLLITITVFFWGPYHWPVPDNNKLIIFLTAVFFAIIVGYFCGIMLPVKSGENISWFKIYLAGIIFSLLLFIPSVYVYTGSFPWHAYFALKNPGIAYAQMEHMIHEPRNILRSIVSLLNILVAPFIFAIIPLAILHWRSLKLQYKFLFVIYIITQFLFSIMRGTEKEIADLIFNFTSAILIVSGRLYITDKLNFNFAKAAKILASGVLIVLVALILFNQKQQSRVTSLQPFCTYQVCASYDGPVLSTLSQKNQFNLSILALYLSEGYYGLSLGLADQSKFQSTYGLGNSLAMMMVYSRLSGDNDLYHRSYLYKIKQTGKWDDLKTWSTIFPVIASDVSFPLVPVVMALVGFLFALSWRDATMANNDYAAIVFTFLFSLFLYAPANNQIAQTLNSYFAFWCWLALWLFSRYRKQGA